MKSEIIQIVKLIFCCFLFIAPLASQNSSAFYANASSLNVVQGGEFTVEFTMNNIEVQNFQPPVFDHLEVISGPNRTSSFSNINGKVSQQYSYTYILRPLKEGKIVIRSAYGDYKGKKLATNPFTITVSKRDEKALEALGLPSDKDIFVRMELSSDTAYLGEKIEVYYKLYTTKAVRSYDIKSESKFQGFFIHHKPSRTKESSQVVIDGTTYNSQILEKRILYPQQTGIFDFEAANITLGLPDGRRRKSSFFFSNNDKPFPVRTNPIKLYIIDLPNGEPGSFSGAVGKFQMQASIDKMKLTTDDAVTIKMVVAGNGDPKYILPPSQEHLKAFDIYDPTTTENGERQAFGEIQTVKTFEYLAVPLKAGRLSIVPEFSYFDTELKKYRTLKSKPLNLEVTQGKNKAKVSLDVADNTNRSLTGRMDSTRLTNTSNGLFGGLGHFSMLGICLLGLGLILFQKRKIDLEAGIDPSTRKRNKAKSVAEKRLSQAKIQLDANNERLFYDEISKSLLGFIADKMNVPNSEISKANVEQKLKEKGIEKESIHKVMKVIHTCEMAIFAGKKEGGMDTIYADTSEAIRFLSDRI